MDHVRATVAPAPEEFLSYVVGQDPEKEVWAALNEFPASRGTRRLVVVRGAERMRSWEPLWGWAASLRSLPGAFALFVSGESDFPYKPSPDRPGKLSRALLPHGAVIQSKGQLVRCAPLGPADLREYARRRVDGSDLVLDYLVARSGSSVAALNGALMKLELFRGSLSRDIVDLFCEPCAEESLTEALLFERKAQAFVNARHLGPDEYARVIGRLNSQLSYLGKMNRAVRARRSMADLIRAGDVPAAFARDMLLAAKLYDEDKRRHCRDLLAIADDVVARGERSGVMEALISMW